MMKMFDLSNQRVSYMNVWRSFHYHQQTKKQYLFSMISLPVKDLISEDNPRYNWLSQVDIVTIVYDALHNPSKLYQRI